MIPSSIKKLVERPEMLMAVCLCGVVLPVVCTAMGFYLGTFVTSQHIQDLQGRDIDRGVYGGIIGFGVSIFVGLGMLAIFPKVVDRDDAARSERDGHAHVHSH
jgi:H+/Cl- antiporter ClcA